ncbi:MAG: HAMP domain-containing histidine kinase [Spirochaetales bacterium]|nr:HAMP domain-containing histidine kinase [Spirochaetales bacterium]
MNLRKRFRYMTLVIILIPLFSIMITVFAFMITWSVARHESGDLSAPRYLKPVLEEILTTGGLEANGFSGIIVMFDEHGKIVFADPKVMDYIEEKEWTTMSDAYEGLMSEMPPAEPFSFSVYQYKGKPGVIIFVEEYFTRIKLFRVLGIILFGLYFILIVLPVLMFRYFMRPLQDALIALEMAAGDIGRGNLDTAIAVPERKGSIRNHPPVLSDLFNAFENMRLELKENHERQSRIMMSISHDLKTPLTLIKGYVEALKDGMAETPEEVVQYAEVVHDRAGLLEERISDLIYFSKLQTTDWQARFEPINIASFLEDTSGIFKNDTFIRKRRFLSAINIPADVIVPGDHKMLFQVLENVFDNSCRYTEDDDEIQLTAEVRKVEERFSNGKSLAVPEFDVVVRMEDSGPGIEAQHIPFIFDSSYRADSGRNTRGSGLGLASAKTIARIHGGDITYIESDLGGAGFELVLPGLSEKSYNRDHE